MRRKVLLFDIDGTLVHSGTAAHRAFIKSFQGLFGIDCSKVVVETAGRCDPAIHQDVAYSLFGRGLSEEECLHLRLLYLSHLEHELKEEAEYRVLPGVASLCALLSEREDVVLGLQTGNLQGAAKLKLQVGSLDTYFAFGGFGCDSSDRAAMVAQAIQRSVAQLAAEPESSEIVVIGDTPHDIAAGKANNCLTVAVATGRYSLEELEISAPDVLLEDFSESDVFLRSIF